MRVLVLLSVFLFCCSSLRTRQAESVQAASFDAPEEVVSDTGIQVADGGVYIPKIVFETEVTSESAQQTIDLIEQTTSAGAKAIVIEINSPGGEVAAGFKLAKAIEESRLPIYCVVDGEADSMAFYILQSCTVRVATARSIMLAHAPSISAQISGKEAVWRSIADLLRVHTEAMEQQVCHRLSITKEDCKSRLGDRDWWMSADEGLKVGALDQVIPDERPWLKALREPGSN